MSLSAQEVLGLALSAAAIVAAFFIGAIPWALIIGLRFYSIDLRDEGSGNLGATNVFRILGPKAAIACAVLDIGKGSVAVLLAWLLVPATTYPQLHSWVLVAATIAAMLGHSYSPYIRFRGGKGIAVAAGALLVLTPWSWPFLWLVFIVVIALTRYVSLGSMACAVAYPLLVLWLYGDELPTVLFSFAAAAIVLWRHRSNMGRLARGEESKIDLASAGQRAREAARRARGRTGRSTDGE